MKKNTVLLIAVLLLMTAAGAMTRIAAADITDDMWYWEEDQPEEPTPVPTLDVTAYSPNRTDPSNFPEHAFPPRPGGTAPVWNYPEGVNSTELSASWTIGSTLKQLPEDAGNVTIYLDYDIVEPQTGFVIPTDKGITSLRIAARGGRRTVWPDDKLKSFWVICNGIPLIIDKDVTFAGKSMIVGGAENDRRHDVSVPESTIIINGSAYWVYAGGQSNELRKRSTVGNALVIVNGQVDRVFAGGRTISGETVVERSTVVVNGYAGEVYCGGYTEYTYGKAYVGQANMLIYGGYGIYGLGRGSGDSILLDSMGCF